MLPEEMEGGERQSSSTNNNNNNNRASHKVLVAVKAEKVISKAALAWALTHVVHPGDCITLLAIIPKEKTSKPLLSLIYLFIFNNSIITKTSLHVFLNIKKCYLSYEAKFVGGIFPMNVAGRRFWNFTLFRGDCGSSQREKLQEKIYQISESCSQMALQFRNQIEVTV